MYNVVYFCHGTAVTVVLLTQFQTEVCSAEKPEGKGQSTALRASPADHNSVFLSYAFLVHSTSFFSTFTPTLKVCHEQWGKKVCFFLKVVLKEG